MLGLLMPSIHTLETARNAAAAMARAELAAHRLLPPEKVLSDETLEAEGCWFFFLSDDICLPDEPAGQQIFTAFAISKCSSSTAFVYDFRSNPVQMKEYVEIWSLHALENKSQASLALDAFKAKYYA